MNTFVKTIRRFFFKYTIQLMIAICALFTFTVYEVQMNSLYEREVYALKVEQRNLQNSYNDLLKENMNLTKQVKLLNRSFFEKVGDFFSSENEK